MALTVVAWSLLSLTPAYGGQPNHQKKKKEVNAMSAHLVSLIDTKSFGSGVLRIGDLNANGAPDLLLVQADTKTREITCLTAVTIHGKVLWQHGKPAKKNAYMYGDLPVQVYDWDNDGRNEVLYIKPAGYAGKVAKTSYPRERAERYVGDATLIVLDATTGEEKRRLPTPAPADDALIFADLTGRGRPQDLVVKDRYWNMWGVSHEGETLWHWKGSTGHFPAIADVDNDGKDEVFTGYALIDQDGKVLFDNHPARNRQSPHSDANWIARLSDGSWRLAFGNGGAHLLTPKGKEIWKVKMPEAQHIVAGRFRDDTELQFAIIDRGTQRTPTGTANLLLVDINGKKLWEKSLPPGSWATACREIDWSGASRPGEILVIGFRDLKTYARIYDGNGEVVDVMPIPWKTPKAKVSGKEVAYTTRADVWGDGRQEVIMFGANGTAIYANPRPRSLPTQYNETAYTGM